MANGLHATIADAEHVMSDEISAAMNIFSDAVSAAMAKRNATVAAAIAEGDEALREITALFHGKAPMPDVADDPPIVS